MLREDRIAWLKYEPALAGCQPARQENGRVRRNYADMKTLLLILTLALAAAASGSPPKWLNEAEICDGWYKGWDDEIISYMKDMPFVVGFHVLGKEALQKAHAKRAKVLLYVTFYQMPPDEYYQHANVKEHPDWICIHADGKEGISSLREIDNRNWVTVCPNSPGFREYALKTARLLMARGADGIFVDNGYPDVECEAPKFNRHKHVYPDKDNIYAYRKLLEDVRAVVKEYGEDKIVIVNRGNPEEQWVGACDGQMWESFICSWAWDNRWEERRILKWGQSAISFRERGCPIVALSYIGHTKNSPREDAYYCYAWARLFGFIWADWFTAKDCARDLYVLRLGKPLGPMKTEDGYFSREFEYGLIVVSSQSKGASFKISGKDHPKVLDCFNAVHLKAGPSGDYEITLDPAQGRAYLW